MDADTLPGLHRQQTKRFGPRVAWRLKRDGLYHDLRWDEASEQISACASALVDIGVQPEDRVGILAENRLEWIIADMAILAVGAVAVPLHSTLSAAQVQYQLEDAGVAWLFLSTLQQFEKVSRIRAEVPKLRKIMLWEGQPPSGVPSWRGFLQQGRNGSRKSRDELLRREARWKPDDVATIIYTSGTTGHPKGVMLTHGNLVSNALSITRLGSFREESLFFNWLPFSHIYARTIDIYVPLALGATVCLAESAETILANLADVQPTNMSGVPRFYEKVLAGVQDADPALTAKRLRSLFGPRMDWLGSGGAPLPVSVAQAYEKAGLMLLQGYGMTESSPVISFNRKDAYNIASVGQPLPGVEVRIADDGEVLTRGPHVMKGYWKNPEATAETVANGWLHTGDLGRLDQDGYLYITGRKKELLVLSNGKKVAPTGIEAMILADPCIDQVVVCGEGKSFLTAVVVPHWINVTQAISCDPNIDPNMLASDLRVRRLLEERISNALVNLADGEQVKNFVIRVVPFSIALEEMTVSLKLRRSVIYDHHRQELEAMYR